VQEQVREQEQEQEQGAGSRSRVQACWDVDAPAPASCSCYLLTCSLLPPPLLLVSTSLIVARLPTSLALQPHVCNRDSFLQRLAHVVYRQRGNRDSG